MKADTTRSTFKQTKHYNGVLMQQGRVQLDADWNEQIDITGHRVETETIDVIGKCGAPMHDSGFRIVKSATDLTKEEKGFPENQNVPAIANNDLLISAGRYYVDGILCENDQIIAYSKQDDLPNLSVVSEGTYLAYLDVWSRHITALEDSAIREVALGGPDTTTRSKTVWQVKLFRLGDKTLVPDCSTDLSGWQNDIAAGKGQLAAQAATSAPSNDPCIVAPGAGYRRLENQHYRVEVHDGGTLGAATFKWSRDNGSIVTKWESQSVNDLTVGSTGRDKVLSFAAGNLVELSDDSNDLLGTPGSLVQLAKVEGNVLTINPASAIPAGPIKITNFPRNAKVRRWDMLALLKPTNQAWLDLEDGVQVQFKAGTFKSGDYWLIPARTATGDVEWPFNPALQYPFGIKHHYCPLAVATLDAGTWTTPTDCRQLFPPLTELINFFYVGGDGQEAVPDPTQPNLPLTDAALVQPLEAGVTNDIWPVKGAQVRFTVLTGGGQLNGSAAPVLVFTAANGVAGCTWRLGSAVQSQLVEAVLLDKDKKPICEPIRYTANLSVASQVAYTPKAGCVSLQNQKTVQQAIDTLATLTSLYKVSGDDQSRPLSEQMDPLVVVAASKCGPIQGMKVTFAVKSGGGKVSAPGTQPGLSVTVTTGGQGLAACDWALSPGGATQVVEAVLQVGPNPIVPPVSVQFQAREQMPPGADPGFHVTKLSVPVAVPLELKNNMSLGFNLFEAGVQIECDAEPDPKALVSKLPNDNPVCFLTVDVPFPFTTDEQGFYGTGKTPTCFQSIILGGNVTVNQNTINWKPDPATMDWIKALFGKLPTSQPPPLLLTRLTLKGNFIWSKDDAKVFLDGDLFADKSQNAVILKPGSGDQRRGGDLNMWFWLVRPAATGLVLDVGDDLTLHIEGLVRDNFGALVSGVSVTLLQQGQPKGAHTTGRDGKFNFSSLVIGDYVVKATSGGLSETAAVTVVGPKGQGPT